MDPRSDPDLDHEGGQRQVETDLREEGADRVGLAAPLEHLGRHVELLIDQRRAERTERDDDGDELDLPRFAQQREGAREADAALLLGRRRRGSRVPLALDNDRDDARAGDQRDGAAEQKCARCRCRGWRRGDRGAGHPAERDTAADEPEHPLGLARVVHAVGQRPELTDEQHAQQQAPQIEGDRHPFAAPLEQNPETHHDSGHADLCDRQRPAPWQCSDHARVGHHEDADDEARPENDPGDVHRAETGDQLRSRQRLNDVVRGHAEERIGEHQADARRFFLPHFHHR